MTDDIKFVPEFRYEPSRGFFVSGDRLLADYESDVDHLAYHPLVSTNYYCSHLYNRDGEVVFKIASLRSTDGDPKTQGAPAGVDEHPDNFQWTPLYHECENLRKAIDWFQCGKGRVRIYRQEPNQHVRLHHDFDNARNDFDPDNITVRVFMQLSDQPNYYRLVCDGADVTVRLEKGQFMILNTDTVWHSTRNLDNKPRDVLNMIVKWNDWLANLTAPGDCNPKEIHL